MRSNSGLLLPADSEPGVEFEEAAEPRFSDDQDGRRDQDKNQGAPAGKREILAGVLVSSFGMMLGLIAAVIGIVHQVPLVIWLPVAGVSSSLSAISWVFLFKAWQYRKGFYARLLGVTYDLAVCADILTRDFDLTFFGEIERRAVEAVISDARLVRDQLFASGDKEEASVLGDQINDVLFSLDDAMYVAATGASD
ncbi:hypothetical protein [Amycolatopsis keratiniphila]|uniref:hypothetical protein n=1 Tax=Amycolatopsis keratiniphila TaxID=129921 RepID=UPI001180ABB5|nr:hypothetical protein [Amycolatopsis keratiniphila]